MDNNLLKQLILRHRRIVIPEFGAFIKKEDQDGDILVFSPFLRKDDGMVTDAIVLEYGVETDDARTMLSEFVAHLKQSLASGRYFIDGVGMLVADANGTIMLKENETPEPEIISAETVTEIDPPQPIRQPAAQVLPATQALPVSQGVTRPQSIQVQASMTPPIQNFQGAQQQSAMPLQQRSSMPQGGYPGIQQPTRPQYQPPRSPVMTQPQQPNVQQRPMQGQPMLQQQMPQQQMQQGGQQMPQQQMGTVTPSRVNYDSRLMGMPNEERINNAPRHSASGEQQRRQRPPHRSIKPPKQKTKADAWLISAIVVAMIVIAMMIWAVVVVDTGGDSMEALKESTNFSIPTAVDTTAN